MGREKIPQGYVVCSVCNKAITKKAAGVCSRCERLRPMPWVMCKICGERKTKDSSGVCSECRKSRSWVHRGAQNPSTNESSRLDDAILVTERALRILILRKQGASFSQIGKELGLNKSSVYAIYTRLIGSPMLSITDEVDGEYIDVSPYRDKSSMNPPRLVLSEEKAE